MSFLLKRSIGRQSLRLGLTKASLLNTIVENCLTASFGMSGMSGTSGKSAMSGVSGVSDVSNSSFRTKSSETFLLKQFFSNSASEIGLHRISASTSANPKFGHFSQIRPNSASAKFLAKFGRIWQTPMQLQCVQLVA